MEANMAPREYKDTDSVDMLTDQFSSDPVLTAAIRIAKENGIKTIGRLESSTEEELSKLYLMGPSRLRHLKAVMRKIGRPLKGDIVKALSNTWTVLIAGAAKRI